MRRHAFKTYMELRYNKIYYLVYKKQKETKKMYLVWRRLDLFWSWSAIVAHHHGMVIMNGKT